MVRRKTIVCTRRCVAQEELVTSVNAPFTANDDNNARNQFKIAIYISSEIDLRRWLYFR